MSAGIFSFFMQQPQLLVGEEADLDSLIQLINLGEVDVLRLLAYPPLQVLALGLNNLGLTVPCFLVSRLHQNQIHRQRTLSGLSGLARSTILNQRLKDILCLFGTSWQLNVRIPGFPFAPISPKLPFYNAPRPVGPYDLEEQSERSPNLWHRHREAALHRDDRPGSSDAARGDLRPADQHDIADLERNDHHDDLPRHAPRSAQNLTQQPDPRRNPSFLYLPYRDPPRTPRPSASPPAPAPPEAFSSAEEPAVPSLRFTSRPSSVHSECLSDTVDLSCECRTDADQYDRTRRRKTATPVAQCKLSASPKPYPELALAAAAASCDSNLPVPLSSPFHENTSFVVAAGEQSKGKAPDRAAPQSPARTSSTPGKNQANKKTTSRRSGSDDFDNEQNGDGEDNERDHEALEGGPRKRRKTLSFRCPKYAADPDGCDPKCEGWSTDNIASVTRHAKKDAKDTPDMLEKIESLSSSKFSSRDRWNAYYDIFGDGKKDLPKSQPFFVKSAPDDLSQMLLQALNSHRELKSADYERHLALIPEYERLKGERVRRDQAIELKRQGLMRVVQKKINDDLQASNDLFRKGLEAAIKGLSSNQPVSNPLHATKRDLANAMPSQTTQENDLRHTGGAVPARTPNVPDFNDFEGSLVGNDQRAWMVPDKVAAYFSTNRSDSVDTYGQSVRQPMEEFLADKADKAMNSEATQPEHEVSQPTQHDRHLQIRECGSPRPFQEQSNHDSAYYSFEGLPMASSGLATEDDLTQDVFFEFQYFDMSMPPMDRDERWEDPDPPGH